MLHLVRQTQRAMSDAARLKFTGRAAKTRLEWTMCAGIYTLPWRVITHPASVLWFFFLSLPLSLSLLSILFILDYQWKNQRGDLEPSVPWFYYLLFSKAGTHLSFILFSPLASSLEFLNRQLTRRVRKTIMSNHIIDRPWGSSWSLPLFKARRMAFDSPSRDFP